MELCDIRLGDRVSATWGGVVIRGILMEDGGIAVDAAPDTGESDVLKCDDDTIAFIARAIYMTPERIKALEDCEYGSPLGSWEIVKQIIAEAKR